MATTGEQLADPFDVVEQRPARDSELLGRLFDRQSFLAQHPAQMLLRRSQVSQFAR
jgi:hypothetical protein